jgi:hypothetical protein
MFSSRAARVVAASQRRMASDLAVAQSSVPATTTPAASVAKKSSGPGIRSKVSSFMVGGALSMGVGYWQLQKDTAEASKRVEDAVATLRHDTIESQAFLRRRIAELEASGR